MKKLLMTEYQGGKNKNCYDIIVIGNKIYLESDHHHFSRNNLIYFDLLSKNISTITIQNLIKYLINI